MSHKKHEENSKKSFAERVSEGLESNKARQFRDYALNGLVAAAIPGPAAIAAIVLAGSYACHKFSERHKQEKEAKKPYDTSLFL